MPLMPGMLTPEQMEALRKAKGAEFDRLFLSGYDSAPQRRADHGEGTCSTRRARGRMPKCSTSRPMRTIRNERRSGLCRTCWRRNR